MTAEELQRALNNFTEYCKVNDLTINAGKTKVMIFGRGRTPEARFYINNNELEIIKEFTYLGVVFSPQLSFSKHIDATVCKATYCVFVFKSADV